MSETWYLFLADKWVYSLSALADLHDKALHSTWEGQLSVCQSPMAQMKFVLVNQVNCNPVPWYHTVDTHTAMCNGSIA